jgi:hypothetical protein
MLIASGSGDEKEGNPVMKQIRENSVSGLEQFAVAMVFICLIPLEMILHLCVSTADCIRSWNRREARQADDGSISETHIRHEAGGRDAIKSLSAPSST